MPISEAPRVSPQLASPLVSTQWLADHLGSESLVVLDASVLAVTAPGRSDPEWLSGRDRHLVHGHIPGAVFADLLAAFSSAVPARPFAPPSAERFASAASAAGVDGDVTVVVYDGADGRWAAHLWWLFRAFGHERVAVLDGGYRKWFDEDRPVDTGAVETRAACFTAVPHPSSWASRDEVTSVLAGTAEGVVVFAGSSWEPAAVASVATGDRPVRTPERFPGSVHLAASALRDAGSGRILKPAPLAERVDAALGSTRRAIVYSDTGLTASSVALALSVRGDVEVAVYAAETPAAAQSSAAA